MWYFVYTMGEQTAEFWLAPVTLAKNRGFASHELNEITRLVIKYEKTLLEAWHEYFAA